MYKLIILDDEEIVIKGMQKVFHFPDFGFEVAGTYSNPVQAMQQLEEIHPDLIITDVRMPLMDGLEFAHKARKILPDVEIVILSGYDDFSYAQTAIKIGVSDYLLKPIKKKDFQKMLKEMYQRIEEKIKQVSYMETMQRFADTSYREIFAEKDEKQESDGARSMFGGIRNEKLSKSVLAAIAYIQEHLQDNISLAEVAEHINISKNYLSDLFRKELDVTFVTFVTQLRIEKAKHYLAKTDMKMYEISSAVGYPDSAYFSTLFKKHTGKTLSEFRRQH